MGSPYSSRQSTLHDGNIITAALFNNEYNALLNAFAYASTGTTGHQHDGTAGEGGNVHTIGDQDFLNKVVVESNEIKFFIEVSAAAVEQMNLADGVLAPETTNDIDLGTSSKRFKTIYGTTLDIGGTAVNTVRDEDNMASDDADGLATQQSIKAYVDAQTVSYGGVQLSVGGSDATPAFNLADSTGYLTSNLSGTITNAQLAGSIEGSKLALPIEVSDSTDAIETSILRLNDTGTEGSFIEFDASGATKATLGAYYTGAYHIPFLANGASAGVGVYSFYGTTAVIPTNGDGNAVNDTLHLGLSSYKFDNVYATNGTIQTSDRNKKQDIEELTEAETRVAVACKGLLRKYKWKSRVESKGDEARTHFGIIAQDLEAAFEAEGLNASKYAMFCSDTWWEHEGRTYVEGESIPEGAKEVTLKGIRYPQLLAFIITAL